MALWTSDEIQYLEESWGTKPIKTIAKSLGRTESSIITKANRLHLGRFLENGDYITVNQLYKVLNIVGQRNWNNWKWIAELNLPTHNKTVKNGTFRVIKIAKFWEWAYCHQSYVDFSNLEENILGIEPEWVKAKRKADCTKKSITKRSSTKRKWSPSEDQILLDYLKLYQYTLHQIAKMMCRTEGAISRRIFSLNIPYRPVPNNTTAYWTKEENDILLNMIKANSNYPAIQQVLNRHSETSIRDHVYKTWKTKNLDNVRQIINNTL